MDPFLSPFGHANPWLPRDPARLAEIPQHRAQPHPWLRVGIKSKSVHASPEPATALLLLPGTMMS